MLKQTVVVDVALAALLLPLDLLVSWDPGRSAAVEPWVVPLYGLLGYAALVWRRRRPVLVVGVLLAHSLLAAVLLSGYVPTLGLWLALGTVAATRPLRTSAAAFAGTLVVTALNAVDEAQAVPPDDRAVTLVVAGALGVLLATFPFGAGLWVGAATAQRQAAERRAAREAIETERRRIAHDLHDVVAHSVSLMVLQAGGAARLLRADPDRAAVALAHVDSLGQQAVDELRLLLGALAGRDGGTDGDQHRPPPGTGDLVRLVDGLRAAGSAVDLHEHGTRPPALQAATDLTVYRLVQEALTNAQRHGGRSRPTTVDVHWTPDQVQVEVTNPAAPPGAGAGSALSTHHGVEGMRERAASVGGRLAAGPGPGDVYRVVALLPTRTRPDVVERDPAAGPGGTAEVTGTGRRWLRVVG